MMFTLREGVENGDEEAGRITPYELMTRVSDEETTVSYRKRIIS